MFAMQRLICEMQRKILISKYHSLNIKIYSLNFKPSFENQTFPLKITELP